MNQIRLTSGCLTMLMACLFTIATWQVAEGVWIYAKAGLAQWLLQRAWSRNLAGEIAVKPWPWADTWPVARLIVPSQNIDQIVLEGAYGRTLAFGPGHAESSGGMDNPGTTILTGHRDTHFRFLHRLKEGDEILLTTRNQRQHRYRVSNISVVDAGRASIRQDTEENRLALVTCYPFDAISPGGPLRYVVMAEEETERTEEGFLGQRK
jgi:sortase A